MTAVSERQCRPRRSVLLVSPLRPDNFAAAAQSQADVLCIDLEDAYSAKRSQDGREALAALVGNRDRSSKSQIFARINSPKSVEGLKDLAFIIDRSIPLDGLMLPKVDSAEEVQWVDVVLRDARLPDVELGVIIETAEGLEKAPAVAAASPRVTWLAFGGYDLSAALGVRMAWEPLHYARSRTSHAAALAGVQVFDCPTSSSDVEVLRQELQAAKDLGFTGKACRTPAQVLITHEAFAPTPDEAARAERIVAATAEAGAGNTIVVDGKMIEASTVLAMRRLIAIAQDPHR